MSSRIECRGLERHEKTAYLEFAEKAFGKNSPQADWSFLEWLYTNPNTLGMNRDLLVLVKENTIVGALHLMRVPWHICGRHFVVPSAHDHFVLPAYRSAPGNSLVPPGLQLVLAVLQNETHVGLFGLSPFADMIYERMRIPTVPVLWLQKIRSRFRAGLQMAASQLGIGAGKVWSASRKVTAYGNVEVTRIPSPAAEELPEILALKPATETYPAWDVASYLWRFFHVSGPKNILLVARHHGSISGRAVVSLGRKRGFIVSRIVDLIYNDVGSLAALSAATEELFADMRVAAALAVTSCEEAAQYFTAHGWEHRKEPVGNRWFTRAGVNRPQGLWICGGAWDYGCDWRLEAGTS